MLVQLATTAGRDDRPNEDFPAALPDCAVLLDGAGGPAEMPSGCLHGTGWYVRQLGVRLLAWMGGRPGAPLVGLLADGIDEVAALHAGSCDLSAPGTPSTTVVMARLRPDGLEYLVLGDSTLLIDRDGRAPTVLTDQRIEQVAVAEQAAMNALPTGTPEHFEARVRYVGRQRELRNRPDGYWITSADPAAAEQAYTGLETAEGLRSITLLSDGATRFAEFSLGDWPDLLGVLATGGIGALFEQIRAAEASDPDGARWPRAKRHDDAAVVHFSLRSEHADRDGDPHPDQDQAAEGLAATPGPGGHALAQFQAEQRQRDADRPDDDDRHRQADVQRAEGETDREVVDAQRQPGDQQPPERLRPVLWFGGGGTESLNQAVDAGGDEQSPAEPPGRGPEAVRHPAPGQQPHDRHGGLEEPEDQAHAQPGAAVHPAGPDAHGRREVRQPQRHGHQEQGEHAATLSIGQGTITRRWLLPVFAQAAVTSASGTAWAPSWKAPLVMAAARSDSSATMS
jgi:hypothetical protein